MNFFQFYNAVDTIKALCHFHDDQIKRFLQFLMPEDVEEHSELPRLVSKCLINAGIKTIDPTILLDHSCT